MSKPFWKSKAIWLGALVAALPQVSPLIRVAGAIAGHAQAASHAADVIDAAIPALSAAQSGDVFGAIGGAIAAVRVATSEPIHWKDAPP